jgi:WD40 repeat protein
MTRFALHLALLLVAGGLARAADPAPVWSVDLKTKKESIAPVESVAFSADGKFIAARVCRSHAYPVKHEIIVWDAESKTERGRFTTNTPSLLENAGAAFAVGGKDEWFATEGPAVMRLGFEKNEPVKKEITKGFALWSLRNGDLMTANHDAPLVTLTWLKKTPDEIVWTPVFTRHLSKHPDDWPISAMALDPKGRRLAVAHFHEDKSQATIALDDVDFVGARFILSRLGEGNARETGRISQIRFNADATKLATAGSEGLVRIWTTANAETSVSWTPSATTRVSKFSAHAIDFDPEGRWLAYGTSNGVKPGPNLGFIDVATGKIAYRVNWPTGIVSVAFSPDGKRLLAGDHLGTVSLWEVPEALR